MTPTASRAPIATIRPSIRATLDARFWVIALIAGLASLVGYGLVAAIIPNPIFGRLIPADTAAVAVWVVSAPLMGMLAATYVSGPRSGTPGQMVRLKPEPGASGVATVGALASFFAIGCPICNKLVLLALGTSGALTLFAPIQPLLGALSIGVLVATLVWRLRLRARGCALATASN